MPKISARTLERAGTVLRSRLARAALARYLRRQLGNRRWQPPRDFASLTRRKPDRGVLAWMTTDPTVWRPKQASRLDGPLEGRRLVVKGSFDVVGVAGSSGTLTSNDVAAADAALVERTRLGGAMLVGKVQMTELGVGGLGVQPHFGTLDNPAAPGFLPGGSSSGSAVAVANGSADFGIGTDALGSVRIPAAFCGLVGLKPTQGAVSLRGYHCVAPSLDCPGPIARTAEDCAALWRVMNDSSRPVWGVTPRPPKRVGLVEQLSAIPVWRPIADAQARILKKLGCQQVVVSIDLAHAATHAGGICGARELADALAVKPVNLDHATPLVTFSAAMGRSIPTWLYDSALGLRQRLRQQVLKALDGVDVLAMPTTAIPPVAASPEMVDGGVDTDAMLGVGAFTPLASVTGLPAITVPTGQGADGRPLAMMFMARPGGEERLLAIAAAVESVR